MNKDELKLLNPSTLEDLIGNDKELISQFQIDFIKQAKVSLEKIYSHFNHENYQEIKEEAHYLKTSAKAVGAEITGEQLQRLEQYSQSGENKECRGTIIDLGKSIKAVYEVIKHGS
jgi:HPt (histidine-containing phosphotransfer) domain-containing protein